MAGDEWRAVTVKAYLLFNYFKYFSRQDVHAIINVLGFLTKGSTCPLLRDRERVRARERERGREREGEKDCRLYHRPSKVRQR